MGFMNCGDQKLRVKNQTFSVPNILRADRVHVMDKRSAINLPTGNPQVAPHISGNHNVTDLLPLRGAVKDLVHIPVETKRLLSNNAIQTEIAVALFKRREKDQFRVTSNTHLRPPRPDRCIA